MENEYMIKVSPCYSAGTYNAPQEHYLTIGEIENNHDDEIALFDNKESAQKAIDELESGDYYLSHGEMGRPSYEIVRVDEENEKPDCYNAAGLDLGAWIAISKESIPAEILAELEAADVEYKGKYDGDSDIYRAIVGTTDQEGDEVNYAIVYLVKSAAIQRNFDDLGRISWDRPGFYKG